MSFMREQSTTALLEMLGTMRPAYSDAENRFVRQWIDPLGVNYDEHGNAVKVVGQAPTVLWSSHTDTVHRHGGVQRVHLDGDQIRLTAKSARKRSNCLGADCSTGVWLMREMILAQVPGLYIFHACEEIGGLGSRAIATANPSYLRGIDYAIAFDRKGRESVITHQGARTASDTFAASIAPMLPGRYRADDTGLFTDTANYVDLIGECSNLSIGYEHGHSKEETQSLSHALALRDAMLAIDVTKLEAARKPGDPDDALATRYGWMDAFEGGYAAPKGAKVITGKWSPARCQTLTEFVTYYPDETADILEQLGVGVADMYEAAPWLEDES